MEVVILVAGCCTLLGGCLLHSTWKGRRASLVLIHHLNLSCAGSKCHTPGPHLSRRAKLGEGVVLTRHHWAKNLHDAGYQPRQTTFPQELNGFVFKTKASHLHRGHRLWSGMEKDGPCHATLAKTHHMKVTTTAQSIPPRSSPRMRTALSVAGHQDGDEKYVTDGPKLLHARNNIIIGTWNVRSLRAAGKVEELTHEMKRYWWNILGPCEVRWKNFGETSTLEGHKLFLSGREDRHEHGVGFLIHKDTVNAIMGCQPISSRPITIGLKASPFNIIIIQAYAPTTDYDDDDIEDFCDQLQEVIDQEPKKDILVVQGYWKAKIGEDASKNWKGTCGQCCNPETNERGLTLLELTYYNNLNVANTSGPHKPSRRLTWRSPGGDYHNQFDYIMVKQRFQSGMNIAKTRGWQWKWLWACNDDLQTLPPKDEKPVQHKDQVQSRETQGPQHCRNFLSNDRRKVCFTPRPWKSGHRNRRLDQQL